MTLFLLFCQKISWLVRNSILIAVFLPASASNAANSGHNLPHWYSALESNEQLVYEYIQWFDKYLKNPLLRK